MQLMSVTFHRRPIARNRRSADLVGRVDLELPIEGVGRDHGRLAAIVFRAALVADLGHDAFKAGQPGDPVLGNLFSLIVQIVSALAPFSDCKQSPTGE